MKHLVSVPARAGVESGRGSQVSLAAFEVGALKR